MFLFIEDKLIISNKLNSKLGVSFPPFLTPRLRSSNRDSVELSLFFMYKKDCPTGKNTLPRIWPQQSF